MAELTNLESTLAEVLGLAEASKGATEKVKGMLDDDERGLASRLGRMATRQRRRPTDAPLSPMALTARRRRSSRPPAKPSKREPR